MPRKLKRGVIVTISKKSGDVKHNFNVGDICEIVSLYIDAKCCSLRLIGSPSNSKLKQTVPIRDFSINKKEKKIQ